MGTETLSFDVPYRMLSSLLLLSIATTGSQQPGDDTNGTQVFVVLSTIFWIVSGVLIHQMWGVIICNQGVGGIKGGLTECHELKIIEILAWVLAGVSVLATIPVLMNATKRRKMERKRKTETSG